MIGFKHLVSFFSICNCGLNKHLLSFSFFFTSYDENTFLFTDAESLAVLYVFQFEVVLERAHLVESSSDGRATVPSHDQIIQTIIFNRADIVMLSFIDVNLDYAVTGG
jgi:hypothetical protein